MRFFGGVFRIAFTMLPGVSGIGSGSGYPNWTAWFGCSSASDRMSEAQRECSD